MGMGFSVFLELIFMMAMFAPRRHRTVVETGGVVGGEPTLGSATVTPECGAA